MGAHKDMATTITPRLAIFKHVVGNGASAGAIIDTADFEIGTTFFFSAVNVLDGSYTFTITEGDDSGLSDGVAVILDKLIGAFPVITAASADGGILPKIGVFSHKRYLRVELTAATVTSGADIHVSYIGGFEGVAAPIS